MASSLFDSCGLGNASPAGAILPNACAMISRSVGHRGKLLCTLRVAAHSAPMMGINRSNLSRRTILLLLVLLGMPWAARSNTLEDSAKELARKIAAALPVQEEVALDIRKLSSLGPNDFAVIEQNLKSELQTLGVRTAGTSAATSTIEVTLSENLTSFVWAAEIRRGDSSQVVFLAFPKALENRMASSGMPITLRSEKFWEGSQRILDAIIGNDSMGGKTLLLLTPDALLIRRAGSDVISTVPIPPSGMATRDPAMVLTSTENGVTVRSMAQICSIDTNAGTLVECHPRPIDGPPSSRAFELLDLARPGPEHVDRGSQITAFPDSCGRGQLYLAAGPRDYTEPDTILLFEATVTHGVIAEKALSDLLHFPGPVMAIQSGGAPPRAIVHDLQSGNYEAYHISISCGQ
jgi:hypothetical protein